VRQRIASLRLHLAGSPGHGGAARAVVGRPLGARQRVAAGRIGSGEPRIVGSSGAPDRLGALGVELYRRGADGAMHEQEKTLIVVLSMHRSGSSLTTNVLQRLGMSLGPFELLGATPYNPYGHFEALPIYELDRRLQRLVFGFTEDLPRSRETFERFCRCEGSWNAEVRIPPEMYREGHELVEQLLASGRISGFKDPRVPLLWPFWSRVLAEFPGLHVVPLFVLRSPHEVAMSVFRRSRGAFSYGDVLEATAIHLTRMWTIWKTSPVRRVLVRFDPRHYEQDMGRAAKICGLPWSARAFAETYDAGCKHYEPVAVTHRSQRLFEQFTGVQADRASRENLALAERDAAVREGILRAHLERYFETLADFQGDIDHFRRLIVQRDAEVARLHQSLVEAQRRTEMVVGELRRIHSTRSWRMRKWLLERLGVTVEEIGLGHECDHLRGTPSARVTETDGRHAEGDETQAVPGKSSAGDSREHHHSTAANGNGRTADEHSDAAGTDTGARRACGAEDGNGRHCPGAAA